MCWYAATTYQVIGANRTTALTGTPAALLTAGVGVGVIDIGKYGFILTKGRHTNVMAPASTLGQWQCATTTNDSCANATASIARTEAIFGMALTTSAGNRATVEVNI